MKRCVIGIRRLGEPEPKPEKGTPTVWFPSMATMATVLSEDNQALLQLIHDQRPVASRGVVQESDFVAAPRGGHRFIR